MSNVRYLGLAAGDALREFADRVDAGEIQHAVVAIREADGTLVYATVGDDVLLLVGLLAGAQFHLQADGLEDDAGDDEAGGG